MRQREPRTRVRLPARLNAGRRWCDATIHNLSRTGIMFSADEGLDGGEYLELRRGKHVMIARIVWSDGSFCGARMQDPICVADIVADRPTPKRPNASVERRRLPRAQAAERSRATGRLLDYCLCAAALMAGAGVLATSAYDALAGSLRAVETGLKR
ncbi:PilZ domain-containing protein [Sphingomicrobium clamense]|uniref:PilZ domain-containing protein n=1 Tax=Sphingomicrobium clamense TaxID=2851013 RepID=A0ABS6V6M5_9SPHN|nr:PilZ domain-containing protein [Sphingomicrobium sp. B8]MBW0144713.1 PilZ domain-containing protein [Sphingomicrobium sp. B8]